MKMRKKPKSLQAAMKPLHKINQKAPYRSNLIHIASHVYQRNPIEKLKLWFLPYTPITVILY